jgi:hypothetical protein
MGRALCAGSLRQGGEWNEINMESHHLPPEVVAARHGGVP